MGAWTFQDDHQVKKRGAERASWYVGWIDPEGKRRCKSCGPGSRGKSLAEKKRRKIEAQLLTGTYQDNTTKTWQQFRTEYEAKALGGLAVQSRTAATTALDHFERIVRP